MTKTALFQEQTVASSKEGSLGHGAQGWGAKLCGWTWIEILTPKPPSYEVFMSNCQAASRTSKVVVDMS